MSPIAPNQKVSHVFVLMLENHSFDNIFAFSGIPDLKVAKPGAKNTYNSVDYLVQNNAPLSVATDPGHEFLDVLEQLAGVGAIYPSGGPYPAIDSSGFAASYATSLTEQTGLPQPSQIGDIMKCFDTPSQLPVIYQLATEFAVCDQWFSSLPGPTWPNRFFVHGASSAGLDHSPSSSDIFEWESDPLGGFEYPNGSIYDALTRAGLKWRLYIDRSGPVAGSFAQVQSIKGIHYSTIRSFTNFAADLQGPYPYQYTFLEPNYGNLVNDSYQHGSSQHPMDGMSSGEALIKAVYEAIRSSPLWSSSLLIVTYDEHGGFYDSCAPGPATPPADGSSGELNQYGFAFDQYGVRVPAVVVSPYVPKGSVDHTLYDHSSVPATLENIFGFPPLTQRDAQANNVFGVLSLAWPRLDCPMTLNPPAPAVVIERMATVEEKAVVAPQPLPSAGNLQGLLGVALKTDIELSDGSVAKKTAIMAKFKTIQTRGQAQAYIEDVMTRMRAAQATQGI